MRYQTALRPDRPIISTRRQPGPGSRAAAHPTVSLQRRRHRRASRPQDPAPLPGFQPVGITGRLDGAARHSSRHPWENPANLCQDRGRGLAPPPALPLRFQLAGCYNQERYGGYSSVAERRSVAADVVGSTPTGRPNSPDIFFLPAKIPWPMSLWVNAECGRNHPFPLRGAVALSRLG